MLEDESVRLVKYVVINFVDLTIRQAQRVSNEGRDDFNREIKHIRTIHLHKMRPRGGAEPVAESSAFDDQVFVTTSIGAECEKCRRRTVRFVALHRGRRSSIAEQQRRCM